MKQCNYFLAQKTKALSDGKFVRKYFQDTVQEIVRKKETVLIVYVFSRATVMRRAEVFCN
jgi:methionine salvage enolase-phosphatase E1